MLDPQGRRRVAGDGEPVDAQATAARRITVGGAPLPRQLVQTMELSAIDRLERMTESGRASRLAFDDGDSVGVGNDEVDLTRPATPVAIEDLEASCPKVGLGGLFARSAELVFACHISSVAAHGSASAKVEARNEEAGE